MKKILTGLFVLALASQLPLLAASKPNESRFYGKILTIHPESKRITVFNKKKNAEAQFVWNSETKITKQKRDITATELAAGDNLVVSYGEAGGQKVASKISVRNYTFKKKQTN